MLLFKIRANVKSELLESVRRVHVCGRKRKLAQVGLR